MAWVDISSFSALQAMKDDLTKDYRLINDIEASATEWEPVGDATTAFTGKLDGQGYKISNLWISTITGRIGLFAVINSCNIKNVILSNVNIEDSGGYVGVIAGQATGMCAISSVVADGNIRVPEIVGGLIGECIPATNKTGVISNCSVNVNIIASGNPANWIGGAIGLVRGIYAGTKVYISACSSKGDITIISTATYGFHIGSFVGNVQTSAGASIIVDECYCFGSVNLSNQQGSEIGGFAGWAHGASIFRNCYSWSPITIGLSTNDVTEALRGVGGFIGYATESCVIQNCYAAGKVSIVDGAISYVGGFFGNLISSAVSTYVSQCRWDISTTGQISTMGAGTELVGKNTAQMKVSAGYSGWDYGTIWDIYANKTYPWLKTFGNAPPDDPGEDWTWGDTDSVTFNARYDRKDVKYKTSLVAIGNKEVWYESIPGVMTEITAANGDITKGGNIAVVEAFQKAFIADGTNFKVLDFSNTKLTVATITSYPARGLTLIGGTTSAAMIVDYCDISTYIYGFRTTNATFVSGEIVTGGAAASVHVSTMAAETAPPHWYNWTVYHEDTTTFGTMPARANIMCLYRGRMALNDLDDQHQWHLSRQGNPWDFKYGSDDAQSPVTGTDAEAGKLGDIPTAFIPYSDDIWVIGCIHKVWIMRGDPAAGGSLDILLGTDGIWGPKSYCFDSAGNLYFMGTAGLYKMPKGGDAVTLITSNRLPDMLSGMDRDTYRIILDFDRQRHGILICATKYSDGTGTNWWYDLRTEGFFPETYLSAANPTATVHYESPYTQSNKLMVACNDGYIRYFDENSKSDENSAGTDVAISAYVLLGPVDVSQGDKHSKVNKIIPTFGTNTDRVDYDVYVNESGQELYDDVNSGSAGKYAGTLVSSGKMATIHCKAKGAAMAIKLTNATLSSTFAVEKVVGEIFPLGG